RWRRIKRKIAQDGCAPAPWARPLTSLLGQAPLWTVTCLPHDRALRHLGLRRCVDDMRSERGPLVADAPVAIAGGSSRNDTHQADLDGSGPSLRAPGCCSRT